MAQPLLLWHPSTTPRAKLNFPKTKTLKKIIIFRVQEYFSSDTDAAAGAAASAAASVAATVATTMKTVVKTKAAAEAAAVAAAPAAASVSEEKKLDPEYNKFFCFCQLIFAHGVYVFG